VRRESNFSQLARTNCDDEPRTPSLRVPSPLSCVLARAHHRKSSVHRLYRETVLLRIIAILRLSGLVYPFVHSSRHLTKSLQAITQLETEHMRATVHMLLAKTSWWLILRQVLVVFCVCTVFAFVHLVYIPLVTALLAPQGPWHACSLDCREAALSH